MVDQMIQKSGKMHEETNLLISNLLDLKHVKNPSEYLTNIFSPFKSRISQAAVD